MGKALRKMVHVGNFNTPVCPHNQKPSWHLCQCLPCVWFVFFILRYLSFSFFFSVLHLPRSQNFIKDFLLLFSHISSFRRYPFFLEGWQEKLSQQQLSRTFACWHTAPPVNSRRLCGGQCMSESSYICVHNITAYSCQEKKMTYNLDFCKLTSF